MSENTNRLFWGAEVRILATGKRGVVIDDFKRSGPSKGKWMVQLIGSPRVHSYLPEELERIAEPRDLTDAEKERLKELLKAWNNSDNPREDGSYNTLISFERYLRLDGVSGDSILELEGSL